MRVAALVLLVLAVSADASVDSWEVAAAANPIEGVTKLLERLNRKITEESTAEAAAYDKYACFCKEQADEKHYAINKATERIDELAALIKLRTSENEVLADEVSKATTRKEELEADLKAASEKSFADFQDYQKFHDDHTQALAQLAKAIASMKEAAALTKATGGAASALIQVRSLVQELDPAAKAYEYKGDALIEKLISLQDKFKKRLRVIEDDEVERKHQVLKEKQANNFELNAANSNIAKCNNLIGEKTVEMKAAKEEKESLEADRDDDQAFLDKLTEECEDKAVKWDARSKRRMGEIAAIAQATQILKGDATAKYASAEKSLAAFQKAKAMKKAVVKAPAFLQLAMDSQQQGATKKKVIQALMKKATDMKSSALYGLVISLRDSPFDSVVRMVKDLITKIDDEQQAEEQEIEDCKNDMVDSTAKRAENKAKMEDEEATIIKNTNIADVSAKEIEVLAAEIAELVKGLAEATDLRNQESAANKVALEDATAGKFSVEKAIKVLKTFYEASFEGGFVQVGAKEEPDLGAPESSDFLGDDAAADPSQQEESKGIFGILQTVSDDYQNAIEKVQEDDGVSEFDYSEFKKNTEQDLKDKRQTKKDTEDAKKAAEDAVEKAKDDLAEWTEAHQQAEYELSILTPRCSGLGASAEMRKKRREEEKAALEDAITILEGMAPAEAPAASEPQEFLQRKSVSRHA